ncbi:MAG: putative response regulator, CheY [Pedosphaera sp.]|nr:putative response regulator, CheY [Pedosphaera sp.]
MTNSITVLLVEDDPNDALFFRLAINKVYPQATVLTVMSVQEAIHCLEKTGPFAKRSPYAVPSMVFVDLQLPVKPGKALVKWIREQPQFKKLLVVVLSGLLEMRCLADVYRLGIDSFILKTVDPTDLSKTLLELNGHWVERGLIADFTAKAPSLQPLSSP